MANWGKFSLALNHDLFIEYIYNIWFQQSLRDGGLTVDDGTHKHIRL